MRVLVSLGVIATVLASAEPARAGDPPSFSDLPVGRFTVPPKKKIDGISGHESVPGIFVVAPKHVGNLPAQHRYVSITTDAQAAAAARAGAIPDAPPAACVTEMHQLSFPKADDKELEWEENLSTEAHAYMRTADNPMSGVVAIHTERLVEQSGSLTLESLDAWIDPQTRGARLISKGSVPLKLVRTPAFGMKVYAGRDERPDGKRFVQFVVVRPSTSPFGKDGQMWAMRDEGVVHSSGCGHQRIALPIEGIGGDSATVVATVVLPKLDANGNEVKEAAPSASKPTAKLRPVFFGKRAPGPDEKNDEREIRTRTMHIQVSVSQTTRDKEPLVSVSSSWGGREQVERFIEPGSSPL
jgi:hypothetical protein